MKFEIFIELLPQNELSIMSLYTLPSRCLFTGAKRSKPVDRVPVQVQTWQHMWQQDIRIDRVGVEELQWPVDSPELNPTEHF